MFMRSVIAGIKMCDDKFPEKNVHAFPVQRHVLRQKTNCIYPFLSERSGER